MAIRHNKLATSKVLEVLDGSVYEVKLGLKPIFGEVGVVNKLQYIEMLYYFFELDVSANEKVDNG